MTIEFQAFIMPTEEEELRKLGRSLCKQAHEQMIAVMDDRKEYLRLLIRNFEDEMAITMMGMNEMEREVFLFSFVLSMTSDIKKRIEVLKETEKDRSK